MVLIFAGYVDLPAYLFHPRKCAPCRSTDPELDCFVELSRARAVAHAEVIIGFYYRKRGSLTHNIGSASALPILCVRYIR